MAVKRLMWTYCRAQPLIIIYEEKRRESSIICTAVVKIIQEIIKIRERIPYIGLTPKVTPLSYC